MRSTRGLLHRLTFAGMIICSVMSFAAPSYADVIDVEGNRRVETETIRSYFAEGNPAKAEKELKATGLFSSVSVRRVGGHVVVRVVPIEL